MICAWPPERVCVCIHSRCVEFFTKWCCSCVVLLLGLAQYLGKFLPHLSDITKPLKEIMQDTGPAKCVRQITSHWSPSCQSHLTVHPRGWRECYSSCRSTIYRWSTKKGRCSDTLSHAYLPEVNTCKFAQNLENVHGSHKFTYIQWWSPAVTQTRLSKWPSVTIATEIIWCRWPESKLDVLESLHCLLWLPGWADTPRQVCVQEQPGTACSPVCPLSWRTTWCLFRSSQNYKYPQNTHKMTTSAWLLQFQGSLNRWV